MAAVGTFQWVSLRIVNKMPKSDIFVDMLVAVIIIDFNESRVADMSAIEALNKITARYSAFHKTVVLKHLSPDCREKLRKAKGIIVVTMGEDPTYFGMN